MATPGRPAQLTPENEFPRQAVRQSVQDFPKPEETPGNLVMTLNIASAADIIQPWGYNVAWRDRQMREFYPSEPYLASAIADVGFMSSTLQWEIKAKSDVVEQAVSDILTTAIAGDTFGWVPFIEKVVQDLKTQDNGAFIELIRDPGMDVSSRFKGPMAPVLGLNHLDANKCVRTGNPEYPVVYTDRRGVRHKLRWYEVIPYSDYPSSMESMNGVGYCAVTRVLRMAQIARSIALYKDEKISGRHFKQIHFVSGVSRQDIKDEMKRAQEEANNTGLLRFILPSILASLDPEKPVSTATIDLASLPDGFDFDTDMKWYISCLAMGFGVDYQEFAPLPGGNIGSSNQSVILHRKSSGKGPGVLMRMLSESFKNYGILPRNVEMRFNDKDEQEELERQNVRTKAMEEMAIAINSHALTPQAAAQDMVRRGIWDEKTIAEIPPSFWKQFEKPAPQPRQSNPNAIGQPVGNRGGNTIVEDAGRQQTGATSANAGASLRKAIGNWMERLGKAVRKVTINVPPEPTPEVKLLVPKQVGEIQKIRRDTGQDIVTTSTEKKYGGYIVTEGRPGELVINAPPPQRPVIQIKMPKVKQEVMRVVRDEGGNIEYTTKHVEYEEDE